MKGLTLTQREQTRLQVLNRLAQQQLTTREAAAILALSRSTVRSILLSAGLPSPRYRRPRRHRHRRQRMPQEGMLLQLDGSYHAWLEDRGPWFTLLLAMDDATGTAPYGVLREREDTHGYF